MGDFNARTGVANDYIELDHIYQADEGILPSYFLEDSLLPKRFNIDKIINIQGQYLLDLCIETRLHILNGRFIGDSAGCNTYLRPRISSTIDYVIVSEDLFHSFSFTNVMPPTELSDHCIIWCGLNADSDCNVLLLNLMYIAMHCLTNILLMMILNRSMSRLLLMKNHRTYCSHILKM